MKHQYETCCVSAHGPDIQEMVDVAREITFATFAKRCDWHEIAEGMGYATQYLAGLKLKDDWYVRYHKSKYQGRDCYFMVQSGIEYIFTIQ